MMTAQLSRLKATKTRAPLHVRVAELSDAKDEAKNVSEVPDASQPSLTTLVAIGQS
jgi:hypothetical protein